MNPLMLTAAAVALAFGLAACERETRTVERGSTTVVQPKETIEKKETVVMPKETVKEKETVVTTPPASGASGPAGPQGEPGKTTEMKKETTTSETTTKKE